MNSLINVQGHPMQIIPGYQTGVHRIQQGIYLQVDLTFRILRNETVLEKARAIREHLAGK